MKPHVAHIAVLALLSLGRTVTAQNVPGGGSGPLPPQGGQSGLPAPNGGYGSYGSGWPTCPTQICTDFELECQAVCKRYETGCTNECAMYKTKYYEERMEPLIEEVDACLDVETREFMQCAEWETGTVISCQQFEQETVTSCKRWETGLVAQCKVYEKECYDECSDYEAKKVPFCSRWTTDLFYPYNNDYNPPMPYGADGDGDSADAAIAKMNDIAAALDGPVNDTDTASGPAGTATSANKDTTASTGRRRRVPPKKQPGSFAYGAWGKQGGVYGGSAVGGGFGSFGGAAGGDAGLSSGGMGRGVGGSFFGSLASIFGGGMAYAQGGAGNVPGGQYGGGYGGGDAGGSFGSFGGVAGGGMGGMAGDGIGGSSGGLGGGTVGGGTYGGSGVGGSFGSFGGVAGGGIGGGSSGGSGGAVGGGNSGGAGGAAGGLFGGGGFGSFGGGVQSAGGTGAAKANVGDGGSMGGGIGGGGDGGSMGGGAGGGGDGGATGDGGDGDGDGANGGYYPGDGGYTYDSETLMTHMEYGGEAVVVKKLPTPDVCCKQRCEAEGYAEWPTQWCNQRKTVCVKTDKCKEYEYRYYDSPRCAEWSTHVVQTPRCIAPVPITFNTGRCLRYEKKLFNTAKCQKWGKIKYVNDNVQCAHVPYPSDECEAFNPTPTCWQTPVCSEYQDVCYPSQTCKAWGTCEGPAYIKRRDADTTPASAAPADANVRASRNTDGEVPHSVEERRDLDYTGYNDGRGQQYQSPYGNQGPPQPQPAPASADSGDDGGDRRFPAGRHNYKYYDTSFGVYNNFAYGAPDRYGQHAGVDGGGRGNPYAFKAWIDRVSQWKQAVKDCVEPAHPPFYLVNPNEELKYGPHVHGQGPKAGRPYKYATGYDGWRNGQGQGGGSPPWNVVRPEDGQAPPQGSQVHAGANWAAAAARTQGAQYANGYF